VQIRVMEQRQAGTVALGTGAVQRAGAVVSGKLVSVVSNTNDCHIAPAAEAAEAAEAAAALKTAA
jgi:hypothetical protein